MIAKGKKTVLLEDILKRVGEFDILAHYLNIDKIPTVINSPLRRDSNPSMGLYSIDGEKISYMDFKTRESGGTFDLLSHMWGLRFEDVLRRIDNDIPHMSSTVVAESYNIDLSKIKSNFSGNILKKKIIMSNDVELEVKTRDWKDYDIEFWEKYGISKEWLIFGNVYPISHIFLRRRKNEDWTIISADKYAYVYVEFKDGDKTIKIYQPYSDKFKWRNKHNSSVWDLWAQLPDSGDKLIITSSRKDALCLWENTGIPSVSLQSETYMPKKHVVNQLKNRFKNIYVLYDNDDTGRKNGLDFSEKFGLNYIEIPRASGQKDPSDIVKTYGRRVLKILIDDLIEGNEFKKN